jgi:hypothetical protein
MLGIANAGDVKTRKEKPMNATENKMIVCDDNALESWRQFCVEYEYELNDIHARRAFGVGYLAGCVWASEAAMQAAKAVIMGEAA